MTSAEGGVCLSCSLRPAVSDGRCENCRPAASGNLQPSLRGRDIANRITQQMGLEEIQGFSVSRLFSETFRRHSELEIEDLLMVGGQRTTPALREVCTDWPTPWMFARLLAASLTVFALMWFAWSSFQNPNLVPGLVMTGSFAVPLAAAVFFFEMNVVRNVSLLLAMRLMFFGGVISMLVALFLYEATDGLIWWMGDSAAGVVEESAKLASVLLILRGSLGQRYPYILNGMLFGAAVGTGFAAFESAGYALRVGLVAGDGEMIGNIIGRGLLSPLGHIVWSAIAAGALWRVKGALPFRKEMLADKRAYAPILLVMALHFLWDAPLDLPMYSKYLVLGAVAWVTAIALVQAGLREVALQKSTLEALLDAAQVKAAAARAAT